MPVQTNNYTIEMEEKKPSQPMQQLFEAVAAQMTLVEEQIMPEKREAVLRRIIAEKLEAFNKANPAELLHSGAGASHLWISRQGGEWNNSRVIFITFQNLYI